MNILDKMYFINQNNEIEKCVVTKLIDEKTVEVIGIKNKYKIICNVEQLYDSVEEIATNYNEVKTDCSINNNDDYTIIKAKRNMIIKLLCEIEEVKNYTDEKQSYEDLFIDYITSMKITKIFFTSNELKTILKNIAIVYGIKEKIKISNINCIKHMSTTIKGKQSHGYKLVLKNQTVN